MAIPKPVFSDFTVFRAISAQKTRKLPDLSGGQIRQLIWWGKVDSNHRSDKQQIYSLSPLATREFPHIQLEPCEKAQHLEPVDGLEPPTC